MSHAHLRTVAASLLIAAVAAADPVVVELPRAGGPVRILVDGSAFEVAGATRSVIRQAAAADRAAISRRVAALRAADPAARIGVVGRVDGRAGAAAQAVLTDRVAVRIPAGVAAGAFLAPHGLVAVAAVDYAPGVVLAAAADGDPLSAAAAAGSLRAAGVWADLQVRLQRPFRATDPLAASQWHLNGSSAADVHVATVWTSWTGAGVNVAVVDDGMDVGHEDLAAGVISGLDTDVLDGDGDPSHDVFDAGHGSVVSGVIGARSNEVGGKGLAFDCGLVGVRMLGLGTTDSMEGDALSYRSGATADFVHVSNNSWGPSDDGFTLGANGALQEAALEAATLSGRGGRGTVFVIAGGNGRTDGDTADYDAFASHRRVIGVAAVGPTGAVASYSERGAGILIAAPGGEFGGGGVVGVDSDLSNVGFATGPYLAAGDDIVGTSFAAPMVAGGVALLLQSRPELSWRDVPHVLARSARSVSGSTANAAGLAFHLDYGFGLMDVQAAVTLGQTWVLLPPESSHSAATSASDGIPDNNTTGVTRSVSLAGVPSDFVVERVVVTLTLTHPRRSDVEYILTSPAGTQTTFSRRPNDEQANLAQWSFTTVDMLGEGGTGTWQVTARDLVTGSTGTLGACSVALYGYTPYAAPATTAVFPSAVEQRTGGEAPLTVQVQGSGLAVSQGGDVLRGPVQVDGDDFTATVLSSNLSQISVPSSYFTAVGTVAVALSSPQVPGPNSTGPAGGGYSSVPAQIQVRAVGSNHAPAGTGASGATVQVQAFTTAGAAHFSDADGDALRYRIVATPTRGSASIDAVTGTITYVAGSSQGSDFLTVVATDGMADSAPVTVTYTVVARQGLGDSGGGCGGGLFGLIIAAGAMLAWRGARRR